MFLSSGMSYGNQVTKRYKVHLDQLLEFVSSESLDKFTQEIDRSQLSEEDALALKVLDYDLASYKRGEFSSDRDNYTERIY